jgi:sugar phosphate isomerase/epimerase
MPVSDARKRLDPTPAPSIVEERGPLSGRLGLSVPYEWWPSAPLLKSYEAAGFDWVQLHSPPASVLADPSQLAAHAAAAAGALETTGLKAVLHAPGSLRAGTRGGDRAFQGLLAYAAELGAAQVVYHALALVEDKHSRAAMAAETRSLCAHARLAERLEVTIAIENLAPLYPGPETLSATPSTLRALVERIGSPAVAICLDVGHAHVIADRRRTRVNALCEPVLDAVSIFHLHDNLGARRRASGDELGVDPLRLDLHLPPGRGTLPWTRLAPLLLAHDAPLLLEVHPPYRPRAAQLAATTAALLGQALDA